MILAKLSLTSVQLTPPFTANEITSSWLIEPVVALTLTHSFTTLNFAGEKWCIWVLKPSWLHNRPVFVFTLNLFCWFAFSSRKRVRSTRWHFLACLFALKLRNRNTLGNRWRLWVKIVRLKLHCASWWSSGTETVLAFGLHSSLSVGRPGFF